MMKIFGQLFPRPIPKKLKSQKPEFNSIPIPPPKQWIPPPDGGGIHRFGGGSVSGFCNLDFFGIDLGKC